MMDSSSENAVQTNPDSANAAAENSASSQEQASSIKGALDNAVAAVRRGEIPKPTAQASAKAEGTSDAPPAAKPNENVKAQNQNDKPFRKERDNNRFGKLTRSLHESDAENARLGAENARLRKELEALKNPGPRDAYNSDQEYYAETARHAARQEMLTEQLQRNNEAMNAQAREEWATRVEATVKDKASFDSRVRAHLPDIDQDTESYVMASRVGPRMLEIITEKFDNVPGAKDAFLAMPSAKRNALLVGIENIAMQAEQPAPQEQQPTQQTRQHQPVPSAAPEKGERSPGSIAAKSVDEKAKEIRSQWSRK